MGSNGHVYHEATEFTPFQKRVFQLLDLFPVKAFVFWGHVFWGQVLKYHFYPFDHFTFHSHAKPGKMIAPFHFLIYDALSYGKIGALQYLEEEKRGQAAFLIPLPRFSPIYPGKYPLKDGTD